MEFIIVRRNKIEQNFAKVLKKFQKYDINRRNKIIKFNYSEIPNSWKEEMIFMANDLVNKTEKNLKVSSMQMRMAQNSGMLEN